jgi:predicted TIM-barrel fold metal-dependent hydrolase
LHFIRHMDKSRGIARLGPWLGGQPTERPSAIFKRHVNVVPYPEDDTVRLVDQLEGTEALVMGSDWPHADGLRKPAEMYTRTERLGEVKQRELLRDNGLRLFAG